MLSTVLHTTPKKRTKNSVFYRFNFNGQEKDDEVYGGGNSYSFEFRMYDPRTGRFLSRDPLSKDFPYLSPYAFAGNDVIRNIDIEGLETYNSTVIRYDDCGYIVSLQLVDENYVQSSPTGVVVNYTVYDLPRSAEFSADYVNDWTGNLAATGYSPTLMTSSFYFVMNERAMIGSSKPTNNGPFGPAFQTGPHMYDASLLAVQPGVGVMQNQQRNATRTSMGVNFTPGTATLSATDQGNISAFGNANRTINQAPVVIPILGATSPVGLNIAPSLTQTTNVNTQSIVTIDMSTTLTNDDAGINMGLMQQRFNSISGILQSQGVPAGNIRMGTINWRQAPENMGGNVNQITFNCVRTTTTAVTTTCP